MEQKFKAGDVVLLRVKVSYIGRGGTGVADNGFCFGDGQFLAVLEPAKVEPAVAPKFAVGQRVAHKNRPDWGTGRVVSALGVCCLGDFVNDTDTDSQYMSGVFYCVDYPAGVFPNWNTHEDNLILVPAPAPKPNPWRIVSEPPDSNRNVKVMLDDGAEGYGWYGIAGWRVWPGEPPENPHSGKGSERTTHVIAWREM